VKLGKAGQHWAILGKMTRPDAPTVPPHGQVHKKAVDFEAAKLRTGLGGIPTHQDSVAGTLCCTERDGSVEVLLRLAAAARGDHIVRS
jgi:hypothetical protein